MMDVRRLERQLDNLIIGGMKLYVNVPKFERRKGTSEETRPAPNLWRDGRHQGNHGNRASQQQQMQHRALPKSYKKALISTAVVCQRAEVRTKERHI